MRNYTFAMIIASMFFGTNLTAQAGKPTFTSKGNSSSSTNQSRTLGNYSGGNNVARNLQQNVSNKIPSSSMNTTFKKPISNTQLINKPLTPGTLNPPGSNNNGSGSSGNRTKHAFDDLIQPRFPGVIKDPKKPPIVVDPGFPGGTLPPKGPTNPPGNGGNNPPGNGGNNPPGNGGNNPPGNGGNNPPPGNGGNNPPNNGGNTPPNNGGNQPPHNGGNNPPCDDHHGGHHHHPRFPLPWIPPYGGYNGGYYNPGCSTGYCPLPSVPVVDSTVILTQPAVVAPQIQQTVSDVMQVKNGNDVAITVEANGDKVMYAVLVVGESTFACEILRKDAKSVTVSLPTVLMQQNSVIGDLYLMIDQQTLVTATRFEIIK